MIQFDKKAIKGILVILCGTILFAWCLVNNQIVLDIINYLFKLTSPFTLGLAMAFVLNVPMSALEKCLFGKIPNKDKNRGVIRAVSLLVTLLLVVLVSSLVIFIVVPEIAATFKTIGDKFPQFLARVESQTEDLAIRFPSVALEIEKLTGNTDIWTNILNTVKTFFTSGAMANIVGSTVSIASGLAVGLMNFFIGLIFAGYILAQKEKLGGQLDRLLSVWCRVKTQRRVLYITKLSNRVFTKFLTGQCLEAVILGSMFFVAMTIFRFPYATLVAVLISVTALIPIFGAFIGCFVGVFLMLVQNPMQAVWFLVLFLILQQIEGNFIYPKVVGSSIGLPAMWVMVAVTIGGSAMGIIGMLIMVPIASVVYTVIRDLTVKRGEENLESKQLDNI